MERKKNRQTKTNGKNPNQQNNNTRKGRSYIEKKKTIRQMKELTAKRIEISNTENQ